MNEPRPSDAPPRLSSTKVTFAILAAIGLLFVGCAQLSSGGPMFDVKGDDEVFGLVCLIAGAGLAFGLYGLAFKSKPSFSLHDDRIEHHSWKQPLYFRDIEEVVFEPGQFWLKREPTLALRLKDGSLQHLPYGLMTHGPEAFAEVLKVALAQYRAGRSA